MIDLETLVAPLGADEFLSEHWPQKPFWSQEGAERVAALAEVPELQSAEAALEAATKVVVFRPDGGSGIVPKGEAALPLYRLGLTCYMGTRHIPALAEATDQLTADLGLPQGALKGEVFCSSGESGVRMHSDFDVNFALLLRGHKRWRIAPNEHIRNQTGACRPPSHEQPDPLQLELADVQPFPEEMPEDALELEFRDGGVLFMPRGWWHETKAFGECLQVNFVVNWPMWTQVLTGALKNRLVRDPDWRGYAFDLFGSPERRERAVEEFAELLAGLGERLDLSDPRALAEELLAESPLKPAGRVPVE